MTAKVILNPYAGRWKAKRKWGEAAAALQQAGVDFSVVETEQPNHGIELARQAVLDGYAPIISAGGDGSISEVVNGMLAAGNGCRLPDLGIIPLGSVNDLAVNLKLPLDLPSAAGVIAREITRGIDICEVRHGPEQKVRYFDNNSAIGLEPNITLIQERIPIIQGAVRYLLATLIGIMQNPQWEVQLEWDEGSYEGPATLVTVGNNPVTGGLFYMTPHADPADGKLTFVYGSMPTRRQILQLLPRTMKPAEGSYIEHPEIHEQQATWLNIRTTLPTPLHADGEIVSRNTQDIRYRINPGCISIFTSDQ